MNEMLRILHLEDSQVDVELVAAALREAGVTFEEVVVKDRGAYLKAIKEGKFDLIISDFSLPSFNGHEALEIARAKVPDVPFVFVSGTIGEDAAIQSLQRGATDYVLKTNLARLGPAVKRAMSEADEKRKLRLAERLREMALEDLKASEARFRGVLETAPDPVIITDSRNVITFVNSRTESVFGYEKDELIGKSLTILVPDRFRESHEKHTGTYRVDPHSRAMNSGIELFGRRKDGTEFPADIMLSPLRMDHELAVLAMIRDVTAARDAEKALKASERRFRSLYEASPVGILSIDGDGRFLSCNAAAVRLFGYTEAELLQKTFNDLTHPDDKAIGPPVLRDLKSGKTSLTKFEKRYVRKDGKVLNAELTVSAVRDEEGVFKHAVSIIEDVTERRAAEEAVRRSEAQYRSLVDGARDAIFSLSSGMIIQSLNPAFEIITGWKREDWLGKSFTDLLHQEDRKRAADSFKQIMRGGLPGLSQYRIIKKSGEHLIGEFNTTVLIHDGRRIGILGIARDVTAQKALEDQLRQSQKLESIGTLAGGIAHDFNNILGIIIGFATLSKKSNALEERVARNLDMISEAAQRGVALVRQLLTFARKQDKVVETFSVNDEIKEIHKLISETFPKVITFDLNLSDELLALRGDRTEIHQAILNLCVNARDAMMDRVDGKLSGGILKISTSLIEREKVREHFPTSIEENYIEVTIVDTGAGMDEATLARVFEPFFTTKERGKGTGLGLSMVYGIVNSHDGFINIASTPGTGTTVTMYLPIHEGGDILEAEPEIDVTHIKRGTETILVVEDEAGLRELLEDALTSYGYKVLTAADGQRAIALFLDYRNIKLVISDIGLPSVGGVDLSESIRRLNPDVKIILASGFVEEEEKKRMLQNGINRFIQKPYRISDILVGVREILDED